MSMSERVDAQVGRGTFLMTLFLQFLAVLSILALFYFHVFREKRPLRGRHTLLAALFHSTERRSVTRSEWKRGSY